MCWGIFDRSITHIKKEGHYGGHRCQTKMWISTLLFDAGIGLNIHEGMDTHSI